MTFSVLRLALDWARVLYRAPVTGQLWRRVREWCEAGEVDLVVPGTGEVFGLRARLSRRGEAVLWGSGVRVVVRQAREYRFPTTKPADAHRAQIEAARVQDEAALASAERSRQPYGVELDVQGAALSASSHGLDVLEDVRAAVELLCYRHEGATAAERRASLGPRTFLGRFDVACDAAVRGARASEWIETIIYRRGNLDDAREDWNTRARTESTEEVIKREVRERDAVAKRLEAEGEYDAARMVGSRRLGRTLYLGRTPAFVRIYERDKHTRDGHWDVLADTLRRECAWDGTSRVLRWELELVRQWMRDQVLEREGESVRLHTLTADELLGVLPLVVRTIADRYRHEVDGEVSAWWTQVHAALRSWPGAIGPQQACPWERLRSVKRARAVERALERAASALVSVPLMMTKPDLETVVGAKARVRAALHDDALACTLDLVLDVLGDKRHSGRWSRLRAALTREGLTLPGAGWEPAPAIEAGN